MDRTRPRWPGQGAASMFSFGHAAGLAEGVVTALQIPLVLVTPQSWKRAAGLIGSDKAASLAVAARLFPGAPLARAVDPRFQVFQVLLTAASCTSKTR